MLQETKLKGKHAPKIKKYSMIRKDRTVEDGGGGVGLLIQEDIAYEPVDLKTELEVVAAKVWLNKKPVIVASVYLPPDIVNANIEQYLTLTTNQFGVPYILAGDYNAHHVSWGSEFNDKRGRIVSEFATMKNLLILNNTEPTYLHTNGKFSHIDLTLISSQLSQQFKWNTYHDLMDSNHYPIVIETSHNLPIETSVQNKWNLKGANWEEYRKAAIITVSNEHPTETCQNIEHQILAAAKHHVGEKGTFFNPKYSKHWWTKECEKVVKERNKALYKYRKDKGNITKLVILKEKQAVARMIIRKAKADSWNQYLEKINKNTNLTEIWKFTKAINGKYSERKRIVIYDENNQLIAGDEEVANAFAKHYSEVGATYYENEFKEKKKMMESNDLEENNPDLPKEELMYNANFSIDELQTVLKNFKNTSPGVDNIPYQMIRELGKESSLQLLDFYNHIWCTSVIPDQWKQSQLIPLLKPGKPHTDKTSYRPIALTNCLGKVMEKMVTQRLIHYIESEGKVDKYQSGFRPMHTTYDALTRIESDIRLAYLRDEYCIGVFLDLEKAFDLVWQQGLVQKVRDIGIQGKLYNYIRAFLKERKITAKIKNTSSDIYQMNTGVPQGSIISPTLFNIMIDDIFAEIPCGIKYAIYADDGAMWLPCHKLEEGLGKMQKAIDCIIKWSKKWGLIVSTDKTKCIIFTKKRTKPNMDLKMQEEKIKYVKSVKYLGMWLDKGLTWGKHIDTLKEKCQERIRILKYISHNRWGSSQEKLRLLYKSLILSKIDYGSYLYATAAETHLIKLDRIQYEASRIILGALKPTPTVFLEAEAELMPLKIRRRYLGIKYISKVSSIEEHPTGQEYEEYFPYSFYKLRPHSLSVYGRIREEMEIVNLGEDNFNKIKVKEAVKKCNEMHCYKSLKVYKKEDWSVEQWQLIVRDLINSYSEYKIIYTDGSVFSGKVGSAYWSEATSWSARLPDDENIFTAELIAIQEAVRYAKGSEEDKYLILTDSLSSITALKEQVTKNPIIINIRKMLTETSSITIEWIPSHIGHMGNDKADSLAKKATMNNSIISVPCTLEKLYSKLKLVYKEQWQIHWDKIKFGLHMIKPKLGDVIKENLTREESIKITRMRLGVCYFTHAHYINNSDVLECEACQKLLTIRHLVIECSKYKHEQMKLRQECEMQKVEYNLVNLLNGSISLKYIVNFMKEIKLYEAI